MAKILTTAIVLGCATWAMGSYEMRITEYMYKGEGGEFIEFTNVGSDPCDMTGWKYEDSHYQENDGPSYYDLSGFGVVGAGESVILTESIVEDFRLAWSLELDVKVLGLLGDESLDPNAGHNISKADTINLFDGSMALVDLLEFDGDQGIKTDSVSGNPATFAALGANDFTQWVLSADGDVFGSQLSLLGDLGNPGVFVPEPATLALLGLGGLTVAGIRR